MTCDKMKLDWIGLLRPEGLLSSRRAAKLRAHLESCVACRREHAVHEKIWSALAELPVDEIRPSDGFVERVLAAAGPLAGAGAGRGELDGEAAPGRRLWYRRPWTRFALAGGIAAAVLVAAGLLLDPFRPDPPSPGEGPSDVAEERQPVLPDGHVMAPGPQDEFAAALENALADDVLYLGGE